MHSFLSINKHIHTILIAISLTILAIIPFFTSASFHDSQRLISTVIITLLASYSILTHESWSKKELLGLLVFLLIGFLTVLNSLNLFWSIIEFSLFLGFLLFSLCFSKKIDITEVKHLVLIFSLIQAFYILRAMLNYTFIIITNSKLDVWEVIDGFDNIRFYAQFISWTLPFIIGYLSLKIRSNYNYLLLIIATLSFSLVFLTGTRAFILGIFFSLISVFIITPHLGWGYLKYILMTGSMGLITYLFMVFLIPNFFGIDSQLALGSTINRDLTNSSGRVEIWTDAITVAFNNPWLGIGPMMTAADGVLNIVAHPHNFIIQLMAEWGIPCTLLVITLMTYLVFKWKKLIAQNPSDREPLALPVTAAFSSAAAVSLVDGVMVMPVSMMYMAIIASVGISLIRTWTPQVNRFKISRFTSFALLIPIFLLLAITSYQWVTLDFKTNPSGAPRFWSHGKLPIQPAQQNFH